MFLQAENTVMLAAVDSDELTPQEKLIFEQHPPSGVTLFSRNFSPDRRKTKNLTSQLQSFSPSKDPWIIAVDQEGGRVNRLPAPFPNDGPAMNLAEGQSDESALKYLEDYGASVGKGLKDLGINVNFAPVLDVLTEESNTAIGDRCFGRDPESVTLRASAYLCGLQSQVGGCLKHFPGQGNAKNDTHKESAVIDCDWDTLWDRELYPFRQLMDKVDLLMVSHCIYTAIDNIPATLSAKVGRELIRDKLGFKGVVVSDDMIMEALPQDDSSWQEAIVATVAAGMDLILICKRLEKFQLAREALLAEKKRSPAFTQILESAASRVLDYRKNLTLA